MNRFFVNPDDIGDSHIFITDSGDKKHIKKVLRLKPGDEIEISDGEKWEYTGAIEDMEGDIQVRIVDRQAFGAEPDIEVTLYQGVPKGSKMDFIIQKCVELGVSRVVPVFMERSVVKDNGKFCKKIDRWQKVADEAVKQCKRGKIPEVGAAVSFGVMKAALAEAELVVFPYENEEGRSIKDQLRGLGGKPGTAAIVIGPEGGFSDSEVDELKAVGYTPVTLGKTILRTETAGMAAISMLMYELEL